MGGGLDIGRSASRGRLGCGIAGFHDAVALSSCGVGGRCLGAAGLAGTMKFLPQFPQRTLHPRASSGTSRTLRQRRFGQITLTDIWQLSLIQGRARNLLATGIGSPGGTYEINTIQVLRMGVARDKKTGQIDCGQVRKLPVGRSCSDSPP